MKKKKFCYRGGDGDGDGGGGCGGRSGLAMVVALVQVWKGTWKLMVDFTKPGQLVHSYIYPHFSLPAWPSPSAWQTP